MKLELATLLVLFTASTVWSAPATPAGHGATINLGRSVGANAVGVEPQGGRFARVIQPGAPSGEYQFSTYTGNQPRSVLAIYVTNKSLIPFEKPAARVVISGLPRGQSQPRIRIEMILGPDRRTLEVTARDIGKNGGKLNVSQLPVGEALNAQLQVRARSQVAQLKVPVRPQDRKPQAIALGDETPTAQGRAREAQVDHRPAAGARPREWIGIRSAGGMFEPVLYPGETKSSRPTYFSTRYPGQSTADLKLFAGNNPYIENAKPYARYVISGFTPKDPRKKGIQLNFKVEADGSVTPTATEMRTGAALNVEKYSDDVVKRRAQPWPQREIADERVTGRIPPTPAL